MQFERVNRPLTAEQRTRHEKIRAEIDRNKPQFNREAKALKQELLEVAQAMKALKRERKARGLSLTDIAEKSGIDKANLSRLENDPYPNPTLETLSRIAHAIGVRLTIGVAAA